MKELLLKYVRYNFRANSRVCNEFLARLDEELWDKPIVSSFPSIRKTLYHIWGAEELWLLRLKGTSLPLLPNQDYKGSFDSIKKKFLLVSGEFPGFIKSADETLLKNKMSYTNTKGEIFTDRISDIILHVVNHSTYHRGQLVTMLRNAGFTNLLRTDYIEFCREKPAG